jgi:exocyst complex protein 7
LGKPLPRARKSPEKLFDMFDMFETLHDLNWRFRYQIQDVFCGEPAAGMEAAAGFIRWLAQSAKETCGDFEDAVEKDASKPPVFVEVFFLPFPKP